MKNSIYEYAINQLENGKVKNVDISSVDKNFKIETNIDKKDIMWLNAAEKPFVVYGATGVEPFVRMPLDVAEKVSGGVFALARHTAGIRLRFRTDSPYIAVHCEWAGQTRMAHMTVLGQSGFDLYSIQNNKEQNFVRPYIPWSNADNGFESVIDVKGEIADYILNFPLYNSVDKLFIGVKEGSRFEEPAKYENDLPVVFYGNSITQGGCASRPGNCYQNFLSRMLNMDYVNLGFSGSGKAEDEMIEYLAGLKMCAFVSDYDHNAPNAEHLQKTHYKLYKAIREKNPDIPYIMLSKPDCSYGNNTSEENERRRIITETYGKALLSGDKNVYFVDGASIFAGNEWQACTVDTCHPNDLGFYRFAMALYPILRTIMNNKT